MEEPEKIVSQTELDDKAQKLVEEKDADSRLRVYVGPMEKALTAVLLIWAVFQVWANMFGTLGAACAVSAIPVVRTYAREFEDGYVNALQVASTAAVTRRFEQLADDTWKPPADRVETAAAAYDLRAYMEQRDR